MSDSKRHKLVFFTGAGISVASGIPTFTEQPDLRSKLARDFALKHPEEYRAAIAKMKETCDAAEPNAAHYAIAEMDCPVITMNIDGLHRRAGTKNLIEIHGRLPNDEEINDDKLETRLNIPVLYGDPAPAYQQAYAVVKALEYGNSILVIVGTSFYTMVSAEIERIAKSRRADIMMINNDAETRVPEICEKLKQRLQKN